MRRRGILISIVLSALLFLAAISFDRTRAGDAPANGKKSARGKSDKSDKDATKLSDKELLKQWDELRARRQKILKSVDELKVMIEPTKDVSETRKAQVRLDELRDEFENEVQPALSKLAPLVLVKRPTDAVAAQNVIGGLLSERKGQSIADENVVRIVAIIKALTSGDSDSLLLIEQVADLLLNERRLSDVLAITDPLIAGKDPSATILIVNGMAHFLNSEFDKAAELAKRAAK